MRINIVYFTSTGNSLWMATKIKEIMEGEGHDVELYEVIDHSDDFITDDSDMLGVVYPVWGLLPPDPLWNFLRTKMPKGENKKIFFIGNCAGMAGDTNMMCERLMKSKGYDAFYFNHIIMPTNFFLPWMPFNLLTKVPSEERLSRMLSHAEGRLNKMCAAVLKFERRLEGTGPLWRLMGWMQRKMAFILGFYKSRFSVAKDRCVDCALCARVCPTGNISKNSAGEIVFGDKCIMCVKCYNLCPRNAILICDKTINDKKYLRYKGPGENIQPLEYRE